MKDDWTIINMNHFKIGFIHITGNLYTLLIDKTKKKWIKKLEKSNTIEEQTIFISR